jgi:hypothetical protein
MTKVLNLDEIETTSDRSIILNKASHAFQPYTVGAFIEQMKAMEEFGKRTDVTTSEYLEHMVATIHGAFPTAPLAELKELSMEKIKLISDFVKGDLHKEAVAGLETADAPAAEAAKNGEGESS